MSAVMIAALTLFLTMPRADAPSEKEEKTISDGAVQPADRGREDRVEKNCGVVQTMLFSRCGHSVTRRVSASEGVVGMDFGAIQRYYDAWQIDSFSPVNIEMSREIDLFCPLHWVICCNEAGEIVLCRNRYGDGMAMAKAFPAFTLERLTEDERTKIRQGIGFDSEEEAEAWLRAH